MERNKLDPKYADLIEEIINAHVELLRNAGLDTLAPVLFAFREKNGEPDVVGNVLIGPKEHFGKMVEIVVSNTKPQAILLLNEAHMVMVDLKENPDTLNTALMTPPSRNPSAVDALVCMYVDKDKIATRALILKETENGEVVVSEDLGWRDEEFGGVFRELGERIRALLREFS